MSRTLAVWLAYRENRRGKKCVQCQEDAIRRSFSAYQHVFADERRAVAARRSLLPIFADDCIGESALA
ncbi:MAG TPA: hypothetical protein VHV83_18930 [Armatimonadota bacterium]|nr:hypothetical protein [Armatimonadota bacterium]